MDKILTILRYEYKTQVRRPAGWIVLAAAAALALLDSFPSPENLARLEFLDQPAYFVSRIARFDALVLLYGLTFLLAGRLPMDDALGTKPLFMAAPVGKGQYFLGKLLGGWLYTFTALCAFLALCVGVYRAAAPFPLAPGACLLPLVKTTLVSALPASLFVAFCAVALPGLVGQRLFYLLAAALFGVNAAYVGSAEAMPCWLITGGDLIGLVWTHPAWPAPPAGGVWTNAGFLAGGALLACCLLLAKPGSWREGGRP